MRGPEFGSAVKRSRVVLDVLDTLFGRPRIEDHLTTDDVTAASVEPGRGRPSIALVLGSGAARGFAHIGVIRTLHAHGIVPDIVIGTSMGALVGGCYANDQLDKLEEWANSLTRRRVASYLDVRLGGPGLVNGGRRGGTL